MRFAVGLLCFGFLLEGACASSQSPAPVGASSRADACSDFDLDVKKVWSEETKVNVQANLMGQWGGQLGTDVARERAQSVTTHMDQISQDWVMLRRSACLDHFERHVGTDAEYQARVDCLNRILARQRTVVTTLNSDAKQSAEAMSGLNGELEKCQS
jgi:hypothetical protein